MNLLQLTNTATYTGCGKLSADQTAKDIFLFEFANPEAVQTVSGFSDLITWHTIEKLFSGDVGVPAGSRPDMGADRRTHLP